MASGATSPSGGASVRTQLQTTALGVLAESVPLQAVQNNNSALTSQRVIGCLVGLRGGDLVTGLKTRVSTSAAGTLPTTARVGLADATGKVLVLSGNVNALASFAAGVNTLAFTAPLTIPADGGYYACIVVNGTWGATQPTLLGPTISSSSGAFAADGSNAIPMFQWSAQTDLPAVNSSLTITSVVNGSAVYFACY